MDMQKLIDAMSETGRRERSRYHLTLGGAIKAMDGLPAEMLVEFDRGGAPDGAHSYRGYYSDLAFETTGAPITVAGFLNQCRAALGRTFEGYKGGDFAMKDDTPLWCAAYGCTGLAIMGPVMGDGKLILTTKEID